MKHFTFRFLSLVFALAGLAVPARSERLMYEKTYSTSGPSNEGQGIVQMPDGGFAIAATRSVHISGGNYQADIMLIRTNKTGDTLWTRNYGSATQRELAEAMSLTPEGDIVVAGYTQPLAGGDFNAYLLCVDETGNQLWTKTIGVASGNEFANGVKVTNNQILIGGTSFADSAQNGDAWLVKTDRTGNVVWQKTFGGTEYDDCWDLELTPEGGAMMTGGTYSYATGMYDDAWLVKTDTAGNMIWRRTYGLADRVDWAWALTPVRTGGQITGYAFTGVKDTEEDMPGAGFGSLHLVKVDTAGTLVWDKSISGPTGTFRREGFDIQQLANGDFAIAGTQFGNTSLELYAIRTDANGNVLWDTSYAPGSTAYQPQAITVTSDGGFAITGNVSTPAPTQYIFVARFGNPASVSGTASITSQATVYPNPIRESLTIEAKGYKIYRVQLLNIAGQLVEDFSVGGIDKVVLTPSDILSGVMMLRVTTDLGVVSKTILFAD